MAVVLKTVQEALKKGLQCITELKIRQKLYQERLDEMRPWLTTKPEVVDKLKSVGDSIRLLKMELRHLQDYKRDVEVSVGVLRCYC